jgi:sulfite reductase (ferredoxin)
MMIRTCNASGRVHPAFYLTLDRLADEYGYGTLRITTRQTFQLHGILKANLKVVMGTILRNMGSTLAACGDVERNIMGPAAPYKDRPDYLYAQEYSAKLAQLLSPQTSAYFDIWVDGEKVSTPSLPPEVKAAIARPGNGVSLEGPEPLYGNHYLPRKFKSAITVPGDNSVDIYTQDIGLIVITGKKGKLKGFNVLVGGGMGRTHGKEETFPLLAKPLGYVPVEQVFDLARAIVAVQRDHGDRVERKHARMKYLINDWGIDKFRQTVEEYLGCELKPFKDLPDFEVKDYLGWHEQGDGRLFLGLSIDNGRVKDEGEFRLKTALRTIVERYEIPLRLTPQQNAVLCEIEPAWKKDIDRILREHGVVPVEQLSPLARYAMACPALPTCGLAITESERIIPSMVAQLETVLQNVGLQNESFIVRMTGCPNGCARPYMAELGFVGSFPESYQIWLGGSPRGDRLAQVIDDRVHIESIPTFLEPIFRDFKAKRKKGESFGDYCDRVGLDYLRSLQPAPVDEPAVASAQAAAQNGKLTSNGTVSHPSAVAELPKGPTKSISIRKDVYDRLKSKALREKTSIVELATRALEAYLK